MMLIPPTPDDLTPWVHDLAIAGLSTSEGPSSAIVAFHDQAPWLLVRPDARHPIAGTAAIEALGILALLPVTHVAVVQPIKLRVPGSTGVARDLSARDGMLLTVGRRGKDGELQLSGTLHPWERDDAGQPRWGEPEVLDEPSPMAEVVAKVLHAEPMTGRELAGVVYAADRFGHGVAVAAGWRHRLGLDRPLAATMVRAEDRDRVRRMANVPADLSTEVSA